MASLVTFLPATISQIFGFRIDNPTDQKPTASAPERTWKLNGEFGGRAWLPAVEILVVFSVLAALTAVRPPDVNESHYLIKAKHYWNPDWCHDDLFLQSANAHQVFFLVAGWPTLFLSLPWYAWLGRICVWLFAAVAWVRVNRALGIGQFISPFSAALFVLLNLRFNLAGEWVMGGFEAKSIAYVLVIWSTDCFIRGRMRWFWPMLGLAVAFHPVIGFWALICFLFSQLVYRKLQRKTTRGSSGNWAAFFPIHSVAVTVLLMLVGCLPPWLANFGTSLEVVHQANQIQVHQRLAHHLVFAGFPTTAVARFAVAVCIWWTLMRLLPWDIGFRRLQWFVIGSLLISFAGLLLSAIAESGSSGTYLADSLLRFYWFRFSDFAVPFCLALMVGKLATGLIRSPDPRRRRMTVACAALLVIATGLFIQQRHHDSRAPADVAALPNYPDDAKRTLETAENWQKACNWIRENTPKDAVFITPLSQQTFKWYAHRAEAVCWKDIPQDAQGIVQWHRRFNKLREIENVLPSGFLSLPRQRRHEIVSALSATHLIIPQSLEDAAEASSQFDRVGLRRIYPTEPDERRTYVVYRIGDPVIVSTDESQVDNPE